MVIPVRASHTLWVDMVGHDIAVVSEGYMAQRAFGILLRNLSVHHLSQFSGRPEFAVASRVMWIFNALHTQSDLSPLLVHGFSAAAELRFVDLRRGCMAFLLWGLNLFCPFQQKNIPVFL